MAWVRETVH